MDKLPGPVLQLLQQCQERGYPLTWNAIGDGNHTTVTLTWKLPQQHTHFSKPFSGPKKRKSPCQIRRDKQRLERWREKRKQTLKPKDSSGEEGGVSVSSIMTLKDTKEFGIQTLVSSSKETSTNTDSVQHHEKGIEFKPHQIDKYCQTLKHSSNKCIQTVMESNDRQAVRPLVHSTNVGKSDSHRKPKSKGEALDNPHCADRMIGQEMVTVGRVLKYQLYNKVKYYYCTVDEGGTVWIPESRMPDYILRTYWNGRHSAGGYRHKQTSKFR